MTADQSWTPAWVALGSNQDDPKAQLKRALIALDQLPQTQLRRHSALYLSPPMGPVEQPDFVNAVAGLLTQLSPDALLSHLQSLEFGAGRRREKEIRWGPRPLDLDLLTYGLQCIESPRLRIPHPGIHDRNFVLLPLLAEVPALEIPGLGSVQRLAETVNAAGLEKIN